MTRQNTYIAEMASELDTTGTATFVASADSNFDVLLELLGREGSDEGDQRLFLDEMSPSARTSMYALILAAQAATTGA